MQEGLVITADKEKIMDDSKVDVVVSEVNDMKSFKVVVKEMRIYYTELIIDAEDEDLAEEGCFEIVHNELDSSDWEWDTEDWIAEVAEVDEIDEDLPRFTYDHKAV